MRNNSKACYFTNFSCGVLDFDIEWQSPNSSAQSTKGNRGIPGPRFKSFLKLKEHLNFKVEIFACKNSLQNQNLFDISCLLKLHEYSQQDCAKTDSEYD